MSDKHIIIGSGLGGLTVGIMLKKARPNDEVIIYDANKHAGGFCNAFEKVTTHNDEKIKFTINIPLISGDFSQGAPIDSFLDYMGVKTLNWNIVDNFYKFYPVNGTPFSVSKNKLDNFYDLTDCPKEKKAIKKFFNTLERIYNDLMYKAHLPPTFFQALKLMITMPKTIFNMIFDRPYLETIEKMGIKSTIVKDILSCAEAFIGCNVDKVSGMAEMAMLQSFIQTNSVQPKENNNFQDLANNFAQRFSDLGGKLFLKSYVDSIIFDKKRAKGVIINGQKIEADNIIICVAQDVIKPLINSGKQINKINKLIKKIDKLEPPNSDYYCYYLIEKSTVEKYPKFLKYPYHIYKLPEGRDKTNWKIALWVPNKCYNDKYYILEAIMTETCQEKIDWWIDLRKRDYQKYIEEKEKIGQQYLEIIQEVEPAFKENPPIKMVLSYTPASYIQYGSKYPISGIATTPENTLLRRMTPKLLENLYLAGNAVFTGGLWGAVAGGWQGFVKFYKDIYKVEIGNRDVLFKPGLKNLP